MFIGGKEIRTPWKINDIKHTLGYFYMGDESHVYQAIDAALPHGKNGNLYAKISACCHFLESSRFNFRSYRSKINAATMPASQKMFIRPRLMLLASLLIFCATMFSSWPKYIRYNLFPIKESGIVLNNAHSKVLCMLYRLLILHRLQPIYRRLRPWWEMLWCGSLPIHKYIRPMWSWKYSVKQDCLDGVINMIFVPPVGGKIMSKHPDFVYPLYRLQRRFNKI